jgi:hypothetical protein
LLLAVQFGIIDVARLDIHCIGARNEAVLVTLYSMVLGLLGLALVCFDINKAAAAEVIGPFGPLTIEGRHMPTPDLPGYSTWTLTASSEGGILGFDFFGRRESQPGDPDARGFFGPMNQVNPYG